MHILKMSSKSLKFICLIEFNIISKSGKYMFIPFENHEKISEMKNIKYVIWAKHEDKLFKKYIKYILKVTPEKKLKKLCRKNSNTLKTLLEDFSLIKFNA